MGSQSILVDSVPELIQQWQGLSLSALCKQQAQLDSLQNALSGLLAEQALSNSATCPTSTLVALATETANVVLHRDSLTNFTIGTNSTGVGPLPAGPGEASWQTVFWALAAIALTTCLQECGKVCEMDRSFAILLRSSPMFCLVDSLVILFQLLFYSVTKGPRTAIRIAAACREQFFEEEEDARFKVTRYIIRGLLALLGIVQAIKLFALKGVPWSQFVGACYLTSFIVNGLLNVFGRPTPEQFYDSEWISRRGDVVPSRTWIVRLSIFAYVAQIVFWIGMTKPTVPHRLFEWADSPEDVCLLPVHILTCFVFFLPLLVLYIGVFLAPFSIDIALVLVPVGILGWIIFLKPWPNIPSIVQVLSDLFSAPNEVVATVFLASLGLLIFVLRVCKIPFWVFFQVIDSEVMASMFHGIEAAWGVVDPYMVTLTLLLIAAGFSFCLARLFFFGILADKLNLRQLAVANNIGWACLFLFVANVGLGLLYYSQVYDAQHTHKPKWVENLGRALFFV